MIKLLYFARLRESLGLAAEEIDMAQNATVADVMAQLMRRGGIWQQEFDGSRPICAAVNQTLVKNSMVIKDCDEVAFFPPVTGG